MSEDSESISQVHDKFFKMVFSDKAKVENYLQGTLNEELKAKIRMETLHRDNNSYVDKHLKEYFSDVVYQVILGETPIKICILFEHKSFVPAVPHLQLLRYMLGIWEYQVLNKQTLTPVLPIVIYHGVQKWTKMDFTAYFASGEVEESLKPFMPSFDYLLTNLEDSPIESIKESYTLLSLQMAFLLMKFIFDKQLDKYLKEIFAGHEALKKSEEGKQYLQTIVLYLENSPVLKNTKMKESITTFLTLEDIIPGTLAWDLIKEKEAELEKILEKRVEKRIEKRVEKRVEKRLEKKNKIETAKNALKKGLSVDLIAEITGLSIAEITKIQQELQSK